MLLHMQMEFALEHGDYSTLADSLSLIYDVQRKENSVYSRQTCLFRENKVYKKIICYQALFEACWKWLNRW